MDVCAELVDWMNDNKILKLSGSQPDDFLVGKYMKEYGFKQDLFEPQYMDAGRLAWTDSIKKALGLIARSTSKKVSSSQIPWAISSSVGMTKTLTLLSGLEMQISSPRGPLRL